MSNREKITSIKREVFRAFCIANHYKWNIFLLGFAGVLPKNWVLLICNRGNDKGCFVHMLFDLRRFALNAQHEIVQQNL